MQTSNDQQYRLKLDAGKAEAWRPHPAVFLLSWMLLAVGMQALHVKALMLVGVLLMAISLKVSANRLFVLLRRTRWIMFSLLLVYGYATPGEGLWGQAGMFSPTLQGLTDGLLQLSRLVFMLASLSVVLNMLSQQQLVGGLYTLAYPLRYFGLSRERSAVRLALTLRYAESSMKDAAADWRGSIEKALAPAADWHQIIELHASAFTWRDAVLLAASVALLVPVLL
jgi:energy-coupling factor transporter transmembrane protein EcfT